MRFSILIFLQFLSQISANAQEVEAYSNIPDGYHITVEFIENTPRTWGEDVTVRVYDKTKRNKLIEVNCSGNGYNEDGIKLDFSEQNAVRYEDFNFDGKPDFGIYIHNGGNYGAHYFNIYLQENGKFIHHKEISELTIDNLRIDEERELITIEGISGALFRYYAEYSVENNKLQLQLRRFRETDFYAFAEFQAIEYDKEGNEIDESFEIQYYFKSWRDEKPNALFEVEILGDENEKIVLVGINKTLYFGIVDKESTVVDLVYPNIEENSCGNFIITTDGNSKSLTFLLSDKRYQLRQTEENGRITNLEYVVIDRNGTKKYYGNTNTVSGNMNIILSQNYLNVESK